MNSNGVQFSNNFNCFFEPEFICLFNFYDYSRIKIDTDKLPHQNTMKLFGIQFYGRSIMY